MSSRMRPHEGENRPAIPWLARAAFPPRGRPGDQLFELLPARVERAFMSRMITRLPSTSMIPSSFSLRSAREREIGRAHV